MQEYWRQKRLWAREEGRGKPKKGEVRAEAGVNPTISRSIHLRLVRQGIGRLLQGKRAKKKK
jgi:hypothetical protein